MFIYHLSHLYDRVKSDLFDQDDLNNREDVYIPSITAMVLLQMQAYIVQSLVKSNTRSYLHQFIHWILLFALLILDNMARLLDVEHEIANLTHKKKRGQCVDNGKKKEELQEIVTITKPCHTIVSPSSSITSPTPTYVRQRKVSSPSAVHQTSPVLEPSRQHNTSSSPMGHVRSLSNNILDKKQHTLRRVTGQREITVQNTIAPIQKSHKHHSHHNHQRKTITPMSSTANSVASRSSSSESSLTKESSEYHNHHHNKPKMVQTRSLTTHDLTEQKSLDNRRPYGRCCPACEKL
ncbi:hypothetical protein RMCBS344292_11967 [Rhizopus microsporus]|nr:hypothetical protein RMCBS344292_11967 [Rhizopus microsporus]